MKNKDIHFKEEKATYDRRKKEASKECESEFNSWWKAVSKSNSRVSALELRKHQSKYGPLEFIATFKDEKKEQNKEETEKSKRKRRRRRWRQPQPQPKTNKRSRKKLKMNSSE